VEVQRSGSVAAAWNVLLVGVGDVEVLTGQTVEPDALGTRVRCAAQDTVCRLRLPLL
jgi:hypothetical protein